MGMQIILRIFIGIWVACIMFSCTLNTRKFNAQRNNQHNVISYSNISYHENGNTVPYLKMYLSFSKDGRLIKTDSLQACLVMMKQDTLKILFSGSGMAGNNILVNASNGLYGSYLEFWSDYNEFEGKSKIFYPLYNTSLTLNQRSYTINDTVSGAFTCQDELYSDLFKGEVTVKATGSFRSVVHDKW